MNTLLPWPAPAVLVWTAGWGTTIASTQVGVSAAWSFVAGAGVAAMLSLVASTGWRRRAIAALGFPLSAALLLPGGGLPALFWLALLVPLLSLYPLRAWRDAPFFPTPAAALRGLDAVITPAPRRLLDAGCGLGDALAALARSWPGAELHGVERSAPMAWLAARRLPAAQVQRADMWTRSWAAFDLVYLFQRPESMARAWAKAVQEMTPGSWLVSLEFPVPHVAARARLEAGGGRTVFVYRIVARACRADVDRPRS